MLYCTLFALICFATVCIAEDISTVDELIAYMDSSPSGVKEINLIRDLDFSTRTLSVPLGMKRSQYCSQFSGILRGNGHSIKNLVMNRDDKDSGLFCGMRDATVENLIFDKTCSFTGGQVGALSTYVTINVTIRNVVNKGFVGGLVSGGLVGYFNCFGTPFSLTFDHCANEGTIKSNVPRSTMSDTSGGLIGHVSCTKEGNLTIVGCKNSGDILENCYSAGGLVGKVLLDGNRTNPSYVVIENSTNSGTFADRSYFVGGLIGSWTGDKYFTDLTIFNCNNTGTIRGNGKNYGGLVGVAYSPNYGGLVGVASSPISVINCTNSATISSASSESTVGGLIGQIQNATVNLFNCTNTGRIDGYISGGFVGEFWGAVNSTNGTNRGYVWGSKSSAGFIGNQFANYQNPSPSLWLVNSANYGKVVSVETACGFVCQHNRSVEITFYEGRFENSLSKGNVSGRYAYGLVNIYHNSVNYRFYQIVVLAAVDGRDDESSCVPNINVVTLNNVYVLDTIDKQCPWVHQFTMGADGNYYLTNTNILLAKHLNEGSLGSAIWNDGRFWLMWTKPLDLVSSFSISFGSPVNKTFRWSSFLTLEEHKKLYQIDTTGYFLTLSDGLHPLIKETATFNNDEHIILCYSMTMKGTGEGSLYFENNQPLRSFQTFADLIELAHTGILDYYNSSIVYELDYIMTKNITVVIVSKLNVTVGFPVEKTVYVYPGNNLADVAKLALFSLSEYIFVNQSDGKQLTEDMPIESDLVIDLYHQVSSEGVYEGSWIVRVGTKLGDISALKPYFVDGYSVVDETNRSLVYNKDAVVTGDMVLSIVKKWVVVIEITPTDSSLVEETEVERTVKNLCGDCDVAVGSKVEDGKVTKLLVTVDSKEAADLIVSLLNELEKGGECHAGILCKTEQAYVAGGGDGTSQGSLHYMSILPFVVALVCILF